MEISDWRNKIDELDTDALLERAAIQQPRQRIVRVVVARAREAAAFAASGQAARRNGSGRRSGSGLGISRPRARCRHATVKALIEN